MSIEQAAAAISSGLKTLDAGAAAVSAAAGYFDEARTLIAQATSRTGRPEAAQAIGALSAALSQLGAVQGHASGCKDGFNDFLTTIASSTDTAPTGRRPSPAVSPQRGIARVEQLRDELPAPIAQEGTGRKTHGRWFVGNGPTQTLLSGEDDIADLAAGYLTTLGADRAAVRAHVEIKLSALVRQRYERTGKIADVTLVRVCCTDR